MNRIQFLKQLVGGIVIILLSPTELFAKPGRVVAKPRKLTAKYTIETAEDLECIYLPSNEELADFQKSIDEFMLEELYKYAK